MERQCEYCKEPFIPKRSDTVYCSHTCRQLAYVLRKAIFNKETTALQGLTVEPDASIKKEITVNNQPDEIKIAVNTDNKITEPLSVITNQQKERKETAREETYNEYQSPFIRALIELTEGSDHTSKLGMLFYEGSATVKWISIRYKCLLECLLMFSEMKEVHPDALKEVCDALTHIIQSRYFKYLPNTYPYTNEIIERRDSIKELCLNREDNELFKFGLKRETKLKMIATRYELANFVPKRKYSELNFKEQ